MADIKIKINLNGTASEETLEEVRFDVSVNNVSKPEGTKTTKNDGQNLISWGNIVKDADGNVVSKVVNGETITRGLLSLADGYVGGADATLGEQGGYNGFVMGTTSDSKFFSVSFGIIGKNIDSVIIYGDRKANQFPTRAQIDNDTNYIYSDDPEWAIVFPNASDQHEITFSYWNRANYNACITHIEVLGNDLVLDKVWLKSVESLSQSTGQPKEIYYGITPSVGNFGILDVNGEISDYIKDGILDTSNSKISIFANNKIVKQHIANIESYDVENNEVNFALTDNRSKLENEWGLNYVLDGYSLYNLLMQLLVFQGIVSDSATEFRNMIEGYTYMNGEQVPLDEYLENIKISYFIPNNLAIKEHLNELFNLAQVSLIQLDDGSLKIVNMRSLKSKDSKVITIPKRNQFSNFRYDLMVKNKYDNVEFEVVDISKDLDEIYSREFSIYDESVGEFTVSGISNTAFMKIMANGNRHLCYLLTVDSSSPIFSTLDLGDLAYETQVIGSDNTIISTRKKSYTKDTFSTLEGYEFNTSGTKVTELTKYRTLSSHTFAIQVDLEDTSFSPRRVKIRLMANKYQSFNVIQRYLDGSANENILVYPKMRYLTTKTLYNGEEMYKIIGKNILDDYSNGVRTATTTISCNDYYYTDGTQAKDWNNGDIIQIGDFVKVEGNDLTWRVTGRNFRYAGVPMIDLELQEVREV